MSINTMMSSALSALNAAQIGMRTASNNVSNVNTPGYARQEVQFAPRVVGSDLNGVEVQAIRRVSDAYLVDTAREAAADAGAAAQRSDFLDRAQAAFDDPTGDSTLSAELDDLFQSFGVLGNDPANITNRNNVLSDIDMLFQQYGAISTQLDDLRGETDGRISAVISNVNTLLASIPELSAMIVRDRAGGTDASGAENQLANTLDELAQYMDVRTTRTASGAVEVRTRDGVMLAAQDAAVLSYVGSSAVGAGVVYNPIMVAYPNTPQTALDHRVSSGELRGLLDVRDKDLPQISVQLGELAALTADTLNAAHNDNIAAPPPNVLTGRNTGLTGNDFLNFTGQATVSVLGADGSLAHTVAIDFDTQELRLDGGGAVSFAGAPATTINDFMVQFNGLGAATMTLNGGVMTLSGAPGEGVAITQDPTTPSDRNGQGFSHFFGLNDVVRASTPTQYRTGLAPADAHRFTPGSELTLQLNSADGDVLTNVTIAMPAPPAGTMNDVLDAMNALGTGLGAFGTFGLDAQGELSFAPDARYEGARLAVRDDTTQRADTGLSFSDFFGLGEGTRAERAGTLAVDAAIAADPTRLALGRLDLDDASYAIGNVITGPGDGAGAEALRIAANDRRPASSAGAIAALTTSAADYVGRFSGDVGSRAATAQTTLEVSQQLQTAADERRASVEGVNLDEELIRLTRFQETYNAAARLIQAAQDMTDTLLSLIR